MGIITLPDAEMIMIFSFFFLFILFYSSLLPLAIMERNGI